ncbi:ankyrin repeat-containing domain protein [Xylariaceae sp. FL0255]|nr:ankyrin repeat-containing domain protein [Xylariaceae sp. FL0255]
MLDLPLDIHFIIAALCKRNDLFALSLSCRQLYQLYNYLLYKYNIKHESSSALGKICQYENQDASVRALQMAINAGTNLERTFDMNVLHILPRAASWLIPGLNQITYYHDLTPLYLAAQNGLRDTVALLLQNRANINISTERSRWTPLLFALNNRQSLTAKSLIDQGAALTTEWGTNALYISAALDLPDIVEYLVKKKGIDPNSGDGFWDTPLIYAITSPYTTENSIPHLLALGADLNQVTFVRGQCWSPLGIALKCRRWELAEQLLDNGADPEHKGDSASSARKHMIPKLLAKVDLGIEVSGFQKIGSLLFALV